MIRMPLPAPRRLAIAARIVAAIAIAFAVSPVSSQAQDAPVAPSPPAPAPPADPGSEPEPPTDSNADAGSQTKSQPAESKSESKTKAEGDSKSEPAAKAKSESGKDTKPASGGSAAVDPMALPAGGFAEPALEPAALELLDKMGKAHRGLAHYSADWEVIYREGGSQPLRSMTRIVYSRPNRFSIARGNLRFVNDSATISWVARGSLETKAAPEPPALGQLKEKPVGSAMMDGPAELTVQLLLADNPREAVLTKFVGKRVIGLKLDRPVERGGRSYSCLRLLCPLARDLRVLVDPSTFRIVAFQRVHDRGDSWSESSPSPFRYRLVRESLRSVPASAFVVSRSALARAADLEDGLIQPNEVGKPFEFSVLNQATPTFTLQVLDDQDQPTSPDPEALKDSTLVLCFWKAEDASFAQLQALEEPLSEWNKRKAGVKLFAVSVGDENTEALNIANSLTDRDVHVAGIENGEVAFDRKGELASVLGVGEDLPAIVVIDPAGRIRIRQVGYRLRSTDRLKKEIDKLLP